LRSGYFKNNNTANLLLYSTLILRSQHSQHRTSLETSGTSKNPTYTKKISRNRELQKNQLTERHLHLRCAYYGQVDDWYKQNVLVVTADEYQEPFGGSSKNHINVNQGDTRFGTQAPVSFRREQWAVSSEDTSITRPHCIWEAEKATDHEDWHLQLSAAKEALRQEVKNRRERCSPKGTSEHRLDEEQNKQIDVDNKKRWHRHLRVERNGGTLKYFTPERLFPYDKVEKEGAKGGLDFHFMAFEVYRKHLFPYVRALA
jgi:hypothetical protein